MAEGNIYYGPPQPRGYQGESMTMKIRAQDAARAQVEAATAAQTAKVLSEASMGLTLNVANGYLNSAAAGIVVATGTAISMAEAIMSHGISPAKLLETNIRICKLAQDSMLRGLANRTPRRSPALRAMYASYRNSNSSQRASGALKRVIGDDNFYEATVQGIRFINTSLLNTEAKHWKRLNFGAGSGAIAVPGKFQLDVGGQLIGEAIGLNPDPRIGFNMPPGFWLGPGGQHQAAGFAGSGVFVPTGKWPRSKKKSGIVTTNFMDAGVKRLVREVGLQYTALLDDYVRAIANSGVDGYSEGAVRLPSVTVRSVAPQVDPRQKDKINARLAYYNAHTPARSNPLTIQDRRRGKPYKFIV
jgi:hypothetical protein